MFHKSGSLAFLTAFLCLLILVSCGEDGAEKNVSETADTREEIYIMEYGDTLEINGSVEIVEGGQFVALSEGKIVGKGVGDAVISVDGAERRLSVQPAAVDVVLFTGQSNMVGRETDRYECDIPRGMAYEFKMNAKKDKLTEVKNPVGETFGNVEVSSGSSIVPRFCADYVEATGRKIIAVHVARGGRPISDFIKNGAIYKDIVTKYGACLEYLEENENFTVGHKFYIMMQGESDTNGTAASAYKRMYLNFHKALKKEFGFEFGATLYTGRNSTEDRAGVIRISEVKKEIAEENEDIIIVSKSAMTWYIDKREYLRPDLVHFNGEGLKKIADECCENIVNYMGTGTDVSKAGIDPGTYLEDPDIMK